MDRQGKNCFEPGVAHLWLLSHVSAVQFGEEMQKLQKYDSKLLKSGKFHPNLSSGGAFKWKSQHFAHFQIFVREAASTSYKLETQQPGLV